MPEHKLCFSAQRGFFSHDNDIADWKFRATTQPSLGLLDRPYPTDEEPNEGAARDSSSSAQWARFQSYIKRLNSEDPQNKQYKLFYMVRHGQGVHNVKKTEVGREEWNRYWAKLPGDSTANWLDAALTPYGKAQATGLASLWTGDHGIQSPQSIYSSPLRRCLQTTSHAFAPLLSQTIPIVKESLRERLGVHTCDERSTRSWIAEAFPEFRIEEGLSEEDELWQVDRRETIEEHTERSTRFLEAIFDNDRSETIALVAHSGTLIALFAATGWGKIKVAAGVLYPLLVCGTRNPTVKHCLQAATLSSGSRLKVN
ncbi:histidine phosphatase superfamily [Ampelomyces quisqualis]|uniref:Histidine phosphatase superfamily n=1 Tax=Ampelomyces quisqualis TaxID=50730 RepID=A0A6A5Q9D8_AMPQU|nr:histidine phosphatase superfamily [Ampelomyces quisqualis]